MSREVCGRKRIDSSKEIPIERRAPTPRVHGKARRSGREDRFPGRPSSLGAEELVVTAWFAERIGLGGIRRMFAGRKAITGRRPNWDRRLPDGTWLIDVGRRQRISACEPRIIATVRRRGGVSARTARCHAVHVRYAGRECRHGSETKHERRPFGPGARRWNTTRSPAS